MIVGIHQPAYLPWLGYFDKIATADVFVILDSVQFDRTWFTQRQYVKTAGGRVLLTIPVRKGHMQETLLQTRIAEDTDWRRKHWKTLDQAYHRAPGWAGIAGDLHSFYRPPLHSPTLTEFCLAQLGFWLRELEIGTEIVRSSELAVTGARSELLLNICKAVGADTYLSGAHGGNYLDTALFDSAGIKVAFQDFQHPVYNQLHGKFVPNLGVIDYVANGAT